MENIDTQTSQSSFNNGYYHQDYSNPSFSSSQTWDEALQNDYFTISDQSPSLNGSSNDSRAISHWQYPTYFQPYPVARNLEGNQLQSNNLWSSSLQVPSTSLQTPELAQYEDQTTPTGGETASFKILAAQQPSATQAPRAQTLAQDEHDPRALQPATTPARKSKSRPAPKQRIRKNSNSICKICGHSFTRESDLRRHHRSVHVDRYWLCFLCGGGKKYSRQDKLNEHLRKKHPEWKMASLGA